MRYSVPAAWGRFPAVLLLLALTLALAAGCGKNVVRGGSGLSGAPGQGTGSSAPRGSKPYTIQGQTYYPLLSADGYSEQGIASWYGKDFHGKLTANGERYDMYGMTAAHKILPFGTQVRVTNLNNNRSIVVRINDRGPFVSNRVIDLTRTGAEKLDMIAEGTAPVRLETLGSVQGLSDGDLTGRFYVQVGAFARKENADALSAALRQQGYGVRVYFSDQVGYWRVQVGPYASLKRAESAASGRVGADFPGSFIVAQ